MAVEVAAGLLLRGDTILACQRRGDQPHPGKWEFPGTRSFPTDFPKWMRGGCGWMRTFVALDALTSYALPHVEV